MTTETKIQTKAAAQGGYEVLVDGHLIGRVESYTERTHQMSGRLSIGTTERAAWRIAYTEGFRARVGYSTLTGFRTRKAVAAFLAEIAAGEMARRIFEGWVERPVPQPAAEPVLTSVPDYKAQERATDEVTLAAMLASYDRGEYVILTPEMASALRRTLGRLKG